MLKFIWGKGSQPTPERLKIQEELFGFTKVRQLIFKPLFYLYFYSGNTLVCNYFVLNNGKLCERL